MSLDFVIGRIFATGGERKPASLPASRTTSGIALHGRIVYLSTFRTWVGREFPEGKQKVILFTIGASREYIAVTAPLSDQMSSLRWLILSRIIW